MKKAALVIALMLAVTAGVMLLRGGRELAPGAPVEMAESGHHAMTGTAKMRLAADAVLAIAPGVASGPPQAAAAPQLSPLMREFKAARAYKPMYERLKAAQRRTPEETWVLAKVLEQCAKVTDREEASKPFRLGGGDEARAKFIASLSPRDPQRDKRIAAFDRINFDPCDGLREVPVTQKDIRGLFAEAAAAGDPKAAADLVQVDLWAQLKDPQGRTRFEPGRFASLSDAQVETLKHAVESGDPGALVSAMMTLQFPLADRSMRVGPDEVPVNTAAMGAAAALVACDLGDDCGPDSKTLQQGCAMLGRCEARTYRDYLFYYALSPETSQLVAQYQASIANAARNRDWSGFTFFRGPNPNFAPYITR